MSKAVREMDSGAVYSILTQLESNISLSQMMLHDSVNIQMAEAVREMDSGAVYLQTFDTMTSLLRMML